MKTKHDISSGNGEDKTTRIFLCFVFCSVLGLCLDYGPYVYAYDDSYAAGLTSFLCFAFCFVLMLMFKCEPGLKGYNNLLLI